MVFASGVAAILGGVNTVMTTASSSKIGIKGE